MSDLISLISRHGYAIVAALVFAEAIGLPVPAALALVAAGAAVGGHVLHAPILLPLALGAMVLGDTLLFLAGKWTGWTLLGFLCKVSANPETCILRSAESFYKRGKTTLVIAKFIPGVNTMGPPLAGSMRMPFSQFVRYDALGAALYILAYFTLGFLGRDFLKAIGSSFQTAGHAIEELLLLGLIVYAAYRIWLVRKNRVYRVVPRVQVQEIIEKLASEEADKVLLVDVRSHGYYDADTARIKGSIRIEPNNLEAELKKLPPDKDVYLYCT
ncbi:MAG TPA: VTT domain-containing protein [Terriglobales bacterium]|jgi:membrane protein DedA with SNARE-associated domain|nr:VTT domain-containing protein [Terriglobales bacterium]